jgi:UDP-N-acetylmuramoyl-tripeptide--D-alanyl-D-alanine ligase
MTIWTKDELILALENQAIESSLGLEIIVDEVVIDSRKITKNGLFIAIKGENNDGNLFAKSAIENGCKTLILDDLEVFNELKSEFWIASSATLPRNDEGTINLFLVKNSFDALYQLAQFSRNRSKAKIIAITGSVGKTSTKEMLKNAFSNCGKTFATIGNLNNHFGVPLSLCNFDKNCDFGIFEIGMNHGGEITPLTKLVRPCLAIITNVGPVHIEFFKDEEGIAHAKSEIFLGLEKSGIALINKDNKHFQFLKNRLDNLEIKNQISFGQNVASNYQILSKNLLDISRSQVVAKLKNGSEISYEISSTSDAVIFNSIIVIAAICELEGDVSKAISSFKNLENFAGRGQIFEKEIAGKKILIIDDSYNASLPSMKAGISHALNLKNLLHKNRVVVALGDMLELGEKSAQIHTEVLEFASNLKIDFAILVGENMKKAAQNFDLNFVNFENSSLAASKIANLVEDGDILYIKGSRGIKMENLIKNV